MTTIAEEADFDFAGDAVTSSPQVETGEPTDDIVPQPQPWWKKLLTTPRVRIPVEEYLDHSMNITGSKGGAYLVRCLSAFTDKVDLAIWDGIRGIYLIVQESYGEGAPAAVPEDSFTMDQAADRQPERFMDDMNEDGEIYETIDE